MKILPVITSLAALAALAILAVVSSFVDSVPFVSIAIYIVSSASALALVGMFLGDYSERAPRLNLSPEKVWPVPAPFQVREARELRPVVPQDILSTFGLSRDPATFSCS